MSLLLAYFFRYCRACLICFLEDYHRALFATTVCSFIERCSDGCGTRGRSSTIAHKACTKVWQRSLHGKGRHNKRTKTIRGPPATVRSRVRKNRSRRQLGMSESRKVNWRGLFRKGRDVNVLSAARFFLFGSRDLWFEIGLPLFLRVELGWSRELVGLVLAGGRLCLCCATRAPRAGVAAVLQRRSLAAFVGGVCLRRSSATRP